MLCKRFVDILCMKVVEMRNEQEDQAWEIRRAKNESEYGFNSQQYRTFRQSSYSDRRESIGTDRAICQRITREPSTGRGNVAGGIIRQLISRSHDRLAKLDEQRKAELEEINFLESALKRLESLSSES